MQSGAWPIAIDLRRPTPGLSKAIAGSRSETSRSYFEAGRSGKLAQPNVVRKRLRPPSSLARARHRCGLTFHRRVRTLWAAVAVSRSGHQQARADHPRETWLAAANTRPGRSYCFATLARSTWRVTCSLSSWWRRLRRGPRSEASARRWDRGLEYAYN